MKTQYQFNFGANGTRNIIADTETEAYQMIKDFFPDFKSLGVTISQVTYTIVEC